MGNLDREIDLMLERSQRRYECLDQQIDLMLEGSLEEASSRKKKKRGRANTYSEKINIIQNQLKAGKMGDTPDGIRLKTKALNNLKIYGHKIKRTPHKARKALEKRIEDLTSEIEALNNDLPEPTADPEPAAEPEPKEKSNEASQVEKAINTLFDMIGGDPEEIDAVGKLLGKLLQAKEDSMILKIFSFWPNKKQVKNIIWLLDWWTTIPDSLKSILARDPRLKTVFIALNTHAENIAKILHKAVEEEEGSQGHPAAPDWKDGIIDIVTDGAEAIQAAEEEEEEEEEEEAEEPRSSPAAEPEPKDREWLKIQNKDRAKRKKRKWLKRQNKGRAEREKEKRKAKPTADPEPAAEPEPKDREWLKRQNKGRAEREKEKRKAKPTADPESSPASTEEDRAALKPIVDEAISLLAKRTLLLGKEAYSSRRVLRQIANVIQKYFVYTRSLRETATPPTPPTRATGGDGMWKQISKKKLISLEDAKKNMKDLKTRINPKKIEADFEALDPKIQSLLPAYISLLADMVFDKINEGKILREDKLTKIVIDFKKLRQKRLDESFLAMFGGWVSHILKAMFGGYTLPVNIRGTQSEVKSFAKALGGEKSYIEAAKRYGLDHPTTYKNKAKLDGAIKGFEKDTGLIWPFE